MNPAVHRLFAASLALVTCIRVVDAHAQDAAPKAGVEYTLSLGGIRISEGAASRELPIAECAPKALAREDNRVFVACGASGIVVLDVTDPRNPTLTTRAPTDGDAVALHVVEGKVWVEIAHLEARPAAVLLRAAAPAQVAVPPPALATEPAAVPPRSAQRSLLAPPRVGGLWEIDLQTRAFLPIGNIGFGLLNAASATYRFDAPVALHGELSPIGVAGGKQGTIGSAAGHGIVALDTHLFELGLGFGAATLNGPTTDAVSSLSFAQLGRLGARDGLAFFYRSNIVVDADKFALGSLSGTLQVALNTSWWLLVGGGGGPIGFAHGDVGARYLVHGDLGPGSLFLTGTIGGAGVFKSTRELTTIQSGVSGTYSYYQTAKHADYSGPALGVGVEWRL